MDYMYKELPEIFFFSEIFLLGKFRRMRLVGAFKMYARGAWLAQLEEPKTLDLQLRVKCRDSLNKQKNLK